MEMLSAGGTCRIRIRGAQNATYIYFYSVFIYLFFLCYVSLSLLVIVLFSRIFIFFAMFGYIVYGAKCKNVHTIGVDRVQ